MLTSAICENCGARFDTARPDAAGTCSGRCRNQKHRRNRERQLAKARELIGQLQAASATDDASPELIGELRAGLIRAAALLAAAGQGAGAPAGRTPEEP